jgi:hypothetical protein
MEPAVPKRPLTILILGCLYIATGALGIAFHLDDFRSPRLVQDGLIWIALVRLTAVVCGAFMLRGANWARWLAVAWMAFHVVVGFLHSVREAVVHAVIFVVIAYLLFRPEARAYFRGRET